MSLSAIRARWALLRSQVARITQREDAEDLLHDAWIRMSERTEPARNPEAFLVRCAANGGWDAYRRERRAPSSASLFETEITGIPDQCPLQDEILMMRRRLDRLSLGVEKLPPRTRKVFLMHRLDGLKYREIAIELGISQSAVEKHMARAIGTLSEWMEHW